MLFFLIFLTCPAMLTALPRSSATSVSFYEGDRKLAILPLNNFSGREDKDYLSAGIAAFLADKMRSLVYIRLTNQRQLLQVTPNGKQKLDLSSDPKDIPSKDTLSKDIPSKAVPPQEKSYRYSRYRERGLAKEWKEGERGRLRLITEKLNYSSETERVMKLAEPQQRARELQVDYLLEGSYRLAAGGEEIVLELWLFDAVSKKRFYFSRQLSSDPYSDLEPLSNRIKQHLAGGQLVPLEVKTKTAGAMIYLDEAYLGKTPFKGDFLPGRYIMHVVQEGFKRLSQNVELRADEDNRFEIGNQILHSRAGLYLQSQPEGASVFLNVQYLGKTPLKRLDLPTGSHRLRIAKEGYIDRFIGIRLKEGELQNKTVIMQKGDTEKLYRQPIYAIFNQTYYDLALYSFLSSLIFYGGWIYYTIESERIGDRVTTEGESGRIDRAVERQKERGRISAGLGFLSLFTSGFLLYRGAALEQQREFGQLSSFYFHVGSSFSAQRLFKEPSFAASREDIAYRAAFFFRF